MAKGQMRTTREAKKPKATEKKSKVPKYQGGGTISSGKTAALDTKTKK